jgi:hypothetical protein
MFPLISSSLIWSLILVVMPCSVMVGYQQFRGPCCLHLHPEDGASVVLRNVSILSQYYTVL